MSVDPSYQGWYLDTFVDVYRADTTPNPTTKVRPDGQYARVFARLPAHLMWTANDNDPSGIGRIKRDTLLTEDKMFTAWDVKLKAGDYVKCVDARDQNFGTVERVKATVRRIRGPDFSFDVGETQTMQEEHPPPEVL